MIAYQIPFVITMILDAIIVVASIKRDKNICYFALCSLSAVLFYLLSFSIEDYFISSFCSTFYFLSNTFLLYFLMMFSFEFTNSKLNKYIKHTAVAAICIDIVSLVMNPFVEVAITYRNVMFVDGHIIHTYHPFGLYYYHLGLCYVLLAVSMFVLIHKMTTTPKLYKGRYTTTVVSILTVVLLNVFFLIGFKSFQLDFSIIFYSICVLLIYFNVHHYGTKQQAFLIRDVLMDHLGGPIAFFDYENKLGNFNKQMEELFPDIKEDSITLESFCAQYRFPIFSNIDKVFEWTTIYNREEHLYNCNYRCLKDEHGEIIGKLLQMVDTTYSRDRLTNLELSQGLYHYGMNIDYSIVKQAQLLVMNVTSLRMINTALGHNVGNQVMLETMSIIYDVLGTNTYMAKLEDGSFVAILLNETMESTIMKATAIQELIRQCVRFDFRYDIEFGISELNVNNSDIYKVLEDALTSLRNKKMMNQNSAQGDLIQSLSQTLLESDYETKAHVERTKQVSAKVGKIIGLSDKELGELALLSILHDIGKIGIPNNILCKQTRLSDDEWEIMKSHAEKGCRIAKASEHLKPIAKYILHHHERYDGLGYPSRLKGEEIPLLSRIITVVDSFDVMTHDRPYHKAVSIEEAKKELLRCSGKQFDPMVVEAYLIYLQQEGVL